jgi:hypothetical protein
VASERERAQTGMVSAMPGLKDYDVGYIFEVEPLWKVRSKKVKVLYTYECIILVVS